MKDILPRVLPGKVAKVRSAAAELCTSGHQSAVDFRFFAEAAQQVEELTKADGLMG